MITQYNISRNLLEVYKTDEENFEPYTPMSSYNETDEEETEEEEEETEEETEEEDETSEEEESKEGFSLHQGEILETYYYGDLFSTDNEYDYEEIDYSGTLKLPEVDKKQCYKGVRLLSRKGWEKYGEQIKLEELAEACLGFITEQTYNEDGVELKISGMTKLLEQEYQFNFTQMKISDILAEMIKTAGMTPVIDPTGLNDMVIDYTNISSEGDDDTDTSGAAGANVKELVSKIIKGKKGCVAKAKAIYNWQIANISYSGYSCSHYSSGDECLQHLDSLNCADTSRLTREMLSAAGISAQVVHGPNHFWTEFTCKGKTYVMDVTSKSRPWNTVYNNLTKDKDCGDAPSC